MQSEHGFRSMVSLIKRSKPVCVFNGVCCDTHTTLSAHQLGEGTPIIPNSEESSNSV